MTDDNKNLGRLEKVELRDVWQHEAHDFTPWLAQEENITLLGNTIGIDLEVEAQEKNVGSFFADILCKDTKDTTNDHWVLIENQLERTDHSHLGQLITYAAGLNAATIIWIANRFTDEHRAALDWMNEITGENFRFLGLEVELWRIGTSLAAPKFNVVSSPNDWTKTIGGKAGTFDPAVLSATKILQRDYWAKLHAQLEETGGVIRKSKPQPQSWMTYSLGRSNCHLTSTMNTQDNWIAVLLVSNGKNAKAFYHLLSEERKEIEDEIGLELNWRELPDGKESQIVLRRENTDPTDKTNWSEQCDWFEKTLTSFHNVFSKRVKKLDANDYQPPGDIE